MRLKELMEEVPGKIAAGDPECRIGGIADHSKRVGDRYLFAAIEGDLESGENYIEEAISAGARAILSRRPPGLVPPGGAWIQAEDERLALARIARNFYGRPDESIRVAGVTGTNGKTTVTYLMESILSQGSSTTARIGTIDYRFAGRVEKAERTTPSPVDLYRILAAARDGGDDFAVLEVSSHALVQKRTAGLQFHAAVFTNLSRDHLDYHGDMEKYFAAKRILFDFLPEESAAVLNLDDSYGAKLAASHRGRIITFGTSSDAWCRPEEWSADRDGIRLKIRIGDDVRPVASPLLGVVNLSNLLAAAAAAAGLGIEPGQIVAGIEAVARIPGRLERIETGRDFLVIVDFAHSPDALEKLLESVRQLEPVRLLCVFGCGGDRDRGKRAPMGRIGALGSDIAVLTSDNPRSEAPEAILEEVERGAREAGKGAGRIETIPDRREAIGAALEWARPGDTVVIAGKGHETDQELPGGTIPFDDRKVVRELLGITGNSETTYGAA